MSAKQAINDKLQGSVSTCLRGVGLLTIELKWFIAQSVSEKIESVNIWQSYKQEHGCRMHFARLANTLLKDEESARDNHVLACNYAKYLPI